MRRFLLWIAAGLLAGWLLGSCISGRIEKAFAYEGVVYAAILIPFPHVVTLLWTNPPDLDLHELRFVAHEIGSADTVRFPSYFGRTEGDPDPPRILPGMPDSMWATFPCIVEPRSWEFWMYAVDTAGNVSERSNVVIWRQEGTNW